MSKKETLIVCENCRFWDGTCRRNAPKPYALTTAEDDDEPDLRQAYWPKTGAMEWCGEFEENE